MQVTQQLIVRVPIALCKIRPEHTELYGEVTDFEIDSMATDFEYGTPPQAAPIHISPEPGMNSFWLNDGAVRMLAAKKLFEEGKTEWEYLNAIVDLPFTVTVKGLLIKMNHKRTKTKKQKCNEAIYLIEQMPLTQGVMNRKAPTTGKPINGRTDKWIGEMVGLKEYVITIIRSALDNFKISDPVFCNSLLECELDSWAEMKRCVESQLQRIKTREKDMNEPPIYKHAAPPSLDDNPEDFFKDFEDKPEVTPPEDEPEKTPPDDDPEDFFKDFENRPEQTPPDDDQEDFFKEFYDEPEQKLPEKQLRMPSEQQFQQFQQYERFKFFHWDSITMPQVGTQTVQVCITSPPYWLLRADYNRNGGLGTELLKTDYIRNVATYFSTEMKRVLKIRGSLYFNIGDTIKDGELQTIPELFLAALKADGWHLVGKIIWYKNRLMNNKGAGREIVRLQDNTEMVYHLVQEPIGRDGKCGYDYYPFVTYSEKPIGALVKKPVQRDNDFTKTREGFLSPAIGRRFKNRWTEQDGIDAFETFLSRCKGDNEIVGGNGGSRNKEVKKLDPEYDPIAVMSAYLPVIPILECSKRNDLILDIFGGSGTVGLCAAKLDRDALQFDMNPVDVQHSLNEYSTWYKAAYGCEPEQERIHGTTTKNIPLKAANAAPNRSMVISPNRPNRAA